MPVTSFTTKLGPDGAWLTVCAHVKGHKSKQKNEQNCVHKKKAFSLKKLTLLRRGIFLQKGLLKLRLGNCDDRREKRRKDVNVNWHFIEGNWRRLRFSKLTNEQTNIRKDTHTDT